MAATKKQLHQELKRNFVVERLDKLGVTHSQSGQPIHELDYESLKYELVLASFRVIDAEIQESKWF